jgi:hypothetical protein
VISPGFIDVEAGIITQFIRKLLEVDGLPVVEYTVDKHGIHTSSCFCAFQG